MFQAFQNFVVKTQEWFTDTACVASQNDTIRKNNSISLYICEKQKHKGFL